MIGIDECACLVHWLTHETGSSLLPYLMLPWLVSDSTKTLLVQSWFRSIRYGSEQYVLLFGILKPKTHLAKLLFKQDYTCKKRSTQQKLIGECDQPWCQNIRAKAFSIKSVTRIRGVKIIRYTTNLEDMDLRDLITPLVHKIVIHFGFDLLGANFEDEYYQKIRGWLEYISSVNINVKRGVKLAKGLNSFGPWKDTMKQSLYKTVYQAQKKFETITKSEMAVEISRKNA